MFVLHGSWMLASATQSAHLALWGELGPGSDARPPRRRLRAPATAPIPTHPSTAGPEQLVAVLAAGGRERDELALAAGEALVLLPSSGYAPLPSPELATPSADGIAAVPLGWWRIPVVTAAPAQAPALLLSLHEGALPPEVLLGSDLRFWTAAARFCCELLARQRVLPALEQRGDRYLACWRPALDEERDAGRLAALARAMPPAGRALTTCCASQSAGRSHAEKTQRPRGW